MTVNTSNPWDNDYTNNQLKPVYEPLYEMLQSFLQSFSIQTVLDFGCGDGNYSFLIGRNGIDVSGIDISTNAIKMATRHKERCGDKTCKFICCNSIPDRLPENSFDAVIMLNSYHCLNDRERTNIRGQINRVLKKGGYLFASVLSLDDESYPRECWREMEPNTFDDGKGRVFHFFSSEELLAELEGFKILNNSVLQNIHPDIGKKSALYVITAKSSK